MNGVRNQSQSNQLTTFVTLGLVFGAFGAHDFYIGKKVDGFLHLLLPVAILIISYFFPVVPFLVDDTGHSSGIARIIYYVIVWSPLIAFIISWVLAIKEVVCYIKNSKVADKRVSLKKAFFISAVLFAIIIGIVLGFIFGFPTFLIN